MTSWSSVAVRARNGGAEAEGNVEVGCFDVKACDQPFERIWRATKKTDRNLRCCCALADPQHEIRSIYPAGLAMACATLCPHHWHAISHDEIRLGENSQKPRIIVCFHEHMHVAGAYVS